MSFKLKEEVGIAVAIDQLIDDDFGINLEIFLLDFNIKKKPCGMFNLFLSFLKIYEEEKFLTCFH
jgi:hypothetical protein